MSALTKLLIATVLMTAGLWLVILNFLGSTDRISDSLDLKSLAYTRPDPEASKPSKKEETVEIVPEVAEELPERPESPNVPVKIKVVTGDATENDDCAQHEAAVSAKAAGSENDTNIDNTQARGVGADGCAEATAEKQYRPADAASNNVGALAADELKDGELTQKEKELREKLGIKERVPPTRAIDVVLAVASECEVAVVAKAPVAVKFRHDSPTIKGDSLHELEVLVNESRRCNDAAFQMQENPLGVVDATPDLTQRRLEELKYFFIQHQVPKTALRYPDDL